MLLNHMFGFFFVFYSNIDIPCCKELLVKAGILPLYAVALNTFSCADTVLSDVVDKLNSHPVEERITRPSLTRSEI